MLALVLLLCVAGASATLARSERIGNKLHAFALSVGVTGEDDLAGRFTKGVLTGTSSTRPTVLQLGPDGRLYVAQQDGLIKAYSVARAGRGAYRVTATEAIATVRRLPNHDDDGRPNSTVHGRQLTGMVVSGTAAAPVLYVSSSDPRVGGDADGDDTNLDTNSGVNSRLTRVDGAWRRLDLVRGLPRSEELHATNGLAAPSDVSLSAGEPSDPGVSR
ncbi:MAG: hypothetical protein ABIR67_07235 [Gaiellaceae bacterium]